MPTYRTTFEALTTLLCAIENEGMLHSERCGCDYCETLKRCRRIVDGPQYTEAEIRSAIVDQRWHARNDERDATE